MIKVSDLLHIVFKGNPKARFEKTFKVLLLDLKGIIPSSFKVTIGNHSHIVRTSRSGVAATRLSTADDLNLQRWSWKHKLESVKPFGGISKSQTWVIVQSKSKREGVRGFETCI